MQSNEFQLFGRIVLRKTTNGNWFKLKERFWWSCFTWWASFVKERHLGTNRNQNMIEYTAANKEYKYI